MYQYKVKKVNEVIDGDTIDIEIDLGFGVSINQRIKFADIDAPETRTKNLQEKERGLKAKEWLNNKLNNSKLIRIKTKEEKDKYGRILGWLYVDDDENSINMQMILEGHATHYN